MDHFLESWGYLAVLGLGLVLASGHVQGEGHLLNLVLVIVAATAADLIGSFAGYLIGTYGGRPHVDRLGKFVLLAHRDLDRAVVWFARRGEPFVLFGRHIPLLRLFVSLGAGLREMALDKFTLFTLIGVAIWCSALTSLGYSLESSYNHVLRAFSDDGYVAGALFVLAVLGLFLHRLRLVRTQEGR
jgi:membrane protein DedA with SNARE-associated domain